MFSWYNIFILILLFTFGSCKKKQSDSLQTSCEKVIHQINEVSPKLYKDRAEQVKALHILDSLSNNQTSCADKNNVIIAGIEVGRYYYFQNKQDSALFHYRKALFIANRNKDTLNKAAINSNMGAAYMSLGFDRSAIAHFIEARKAMEKSDVRDENYWIILINQGVAHMNQMAFDHAERLFLNVNDTDSPTLHFLKAINLAKLAGLQDDYSKYQYQIKRAAKHLDQLSFYQYIFDEVSLQFAIKFRNFNTLKKYQKECDTRYNQTNSLYLKVLLQTVSFLKKGQFVGGLVEFENLKKQVISENIVETESDLVDLEILAYKDSKSSTNYLIALEKKEIILARLQSQEKENELSDFYELSATRDLEVKNNKLTAQQKILVLKAKNQLIFVVFVSILGLFVLVIFWLINLNLGKRKDFEVDRRKFFEQSLTEIKLQQSILEQLLITEEKRFSSTLKQIKKIEVLKKQINDFFLLVAPQFIGSEKDLYKSAKLNIDAFFFNYQEMALISSQKSLNIFSFEMVEQKLSPNFSYKEVQVANLILNDYTSKEIAILLSKSEKTIEYSRKNIRQKLNLNIDKDLKSELIQILSTEN